MILEEEEKNEMKHKIKGGEKEKRKEVKRKR